MFSNLGLSRLLRWVLRELIEVDRANVHFSASRILLTHFTLKPRAVRAPPAPKRVRVP